MEDRINKIEKDLALMSQTQRLMSDSLSEISSTLKQISKVTTDYNVLEQRVQFMDKELTESFQRVHKRLDRIDAIHTKIIWLILTPVVVAIIGLVVTK